MRSRVRAGGDDGFALVLVIGAASVLTLLSIVFFGIVNRSASSARNHTSYDQSLSAAESGIDLGLSRLNKVYNSTQSDTYASPESSSDAPSDAESTCRYSRDSYKVPSSWSVTPPTTVQERTWARTTIVNLASSHSDCVRHSNYGDFVMLKPFGWKTVYSMGWAPKYGSTHARTRLVKAEYLFTPYQPSDAVLTGGNLIIDSSTTVYGDTTADNSLAAVHSNANVLVTGGNPTVGGPVSQSNDNPNASSNNFQSNTGGGVVQTPQEYVPTISATSMWSQYAPTWPSTSTTPWYDLCPDGTVHSAASDAAASTPGPCQGSPLASSSCGNVTGNLGWSYSGTCGTTTNYGTWTFTYGLAAVDPSGIWFAHYANVQAGNCSGGVCGSTGTLPSFTVIAEANESTGCDHPGGNINWDAYNISAPAFVTNFGAKLFMLADSDLTTGSSWSAGSLSPSVVSGGFVAGNQVNMQTSSAGAVGTVVAGDQCPPNSGDPYGASVIKNPAIYYDPNSSLPLGSIVRTTLWLEYPSGG